MILTSLLIGTQIFNPQLMVSADAIDLLTSKKVYFPGEIIQIIGHFLPNAVLHIDLVNPLDNSKNSTQVQTDDTGRFQKKILIPYNAVNGTWKILASSGNRLLSVDISIISSNYNKQNETINTNSLGPTWVSPKIESPLKQFKSGTSAKSIVCGEGLILVIKADDGSPACVKLQTAQKLVERGWGTLKTIVTQNQSSVVNQESSTKESIRIITEPGQSNGIGKNGFVDATSTIEIIFDNFKQTASPLIIQIFNPHGGIYKVDNIPSSNIQPDGFYKYQIYIKGNESTMGEYRVVITHNNATAFTSTYLTNVVP